MAWFINRHHLRQDRVEQEKACGGDLQVGAVVAEKVDLRQLRDGAFVHQPR